VCWCLLWTVLFILYSDGWDGYGFFGSDVEDLVMRIYVFLLFAAAVYFSVPFSFATQPLFIVAKMQCEYVYEFSTSSSSYGV
jgi:hypothetical protein